MSMRSLSLGVLVLLLFSAQGARSEPYYPFNAVDFLVPVDELDAAAVEEAAVHSGFRPVLDSNPKVAALRAAPDPLYEMWELPSHKVATITLTRMAKTNSFVVMFVSKDPGKHNSSLTGDACKKWLSFSSAMRTEFGRGQPKIRFRLPQCTP
jgi:hypothetical protein